MLHSVLLIIHFICAFSIIGLVLLQRGKGAEAGAGFGSGASGTVFGARGASTALSRATGILAGVFMLTSLSLTYVGTHKSVAPSSSILEQLQQQQQQPQSGAPANSPTTVPVLPGAPTGSAIPSTTPTTTPDPAAPAAPSSGAPQPKK